MRGDPRLARLAAVAAARRLSAERRSASSRDRLQRSREQAGAADDATRAAEAEAEAALGGAFAASRGVDGPALEALLYGARVMDERAREAARAAERRVEEVRMAEDGHLRSVREHVRAIRREEALGALLGARRAASRRAAERREADDRGPGRGPA